MLKNDTLECNASNRYCECDDFDRLFGELVDTIGMLLPILQLASACENAQRAEALALAVQTSARASLVMKKLLWKWNGLRGWADEEKGLRTPSELLAEIQAAIEHFQATASLTRRRRNTLPSNRR